MSDNKEFITLYEDEETIYARENKWKPHKLGELLQIVMTEVLPCYIKNIDYEAQKIYDTLIVYLYLNNLIEEELVYGISSSIYRSDRDDMSVKKTIKDQFRRILHGLKIDKTYKNFIELVSYLNRYIIDDWYYFVGNQIMSIYFMGIYRLIDDKLYYIGRNEESNGIVLKRLNVANITSETELESETNVTILAEGFINIAAVEPLEKLIYLEPINEANYFGIYDVKKDNLTICKGSYLASAGKMTVLERDGYLNVFENGHTRMVKEYRNCERFERKENYFLVTPLPKRDWSIFLPYNLYFDGHIELADKSDYMSFLWGWITDDLWTEYVCGYMSVEDFKNGKVNPHFPKEFSIGGVKNCLQWMIPEEVKEINKHYIRMIKILDILSNNMRMDEDVSELLFTLVEANRYLGTGHDFPTEALFRRLSVMDSKHKGKDCLLKELIHNHDYDKLFVELLRESAVGKYVIQENTNRFQLIQLLDSMQRKETDMNNKKIGTFRKEGNEIRVGLKSTEDSIVIGSQLVPKENLEEERCIVTYDVNAKRSYVISDIELNATERRIIVREFGLDEEAVTFVQQE